MFKFSWYRCLHAQVLNQNFFKHLLYTYADIKGIKTSSYNLKKKSHSKLELKRKYKIWNSYQPCWTKLNQTSYEQNSISKLKLGMTQLHVPGIILPLNWINYCNFNILVNLTGLSTHSFILTLYHTFILSLNEKLLMTSIKIFSPLFRIILQSASHSFHQNFIKWWL